jgi:hypothetical protein
LRYAHTAHTLTDRADAHIRTYEPTPCGIGMCSGTGLPTTTRCLQRRGCCALGRPHEPWSMRLPPWRPLGVHTATLVCVNGSRWCRRETLTTELRVKLLDILTLQSVDAGNIALGRMRAACRCENVNGEGRFGFPPYCSHRFPVALYFIGLAQIIATASFFGGVCRKHS